MSVTKRAVRTRDAILLRGCREMLLSYKPALASMPEILERATVKLADRWESHVANEIERAIHGDPSAPKPRGLLETWGLDKRGGKSGID